MDLGAFGSDLYDDFCVILSFCDGGLALLLVMEGRKLDLFIVYFRADGRNVKIIILTLGGNTTTVIAGTFLFKLWDRGIRESTAVFTGATSKRAISSFFVEGISISSVLGLGARVVRDLDLEGDS